MTLSSLSLVQREAERLLSLAAGKVTRADLQQLIKKCQQLRPAIHPATLQTQYMQLHLRDPAIPYHSELLWWVTEAPNWISKSAVLRQVSQQPHQITVYTDASKTGWGAHIGDQQHAQGPLRDPSKTSNWRELSAIGLSLTAFPATIKSHHRVTVRTDSRTAASYVNKEGGRVVGLVEEGKRVLLEVAWPRFLVVSATHVSGVQNRIADRLSRTL